jgi:hypothetical protein
MTLDVNWLNYGRDSEGKLRTRVKKGLTIAKGNCNSMKSEIAGKMISDVMGFSETSAAIAKLLNATSTI